MTELETRWFLCYWWVYRLTLITLDGVSSCGGGHNGISNCNYRTFVTSWVSIICQRAWRIMSQYHVYYYHGLRNHTQAYCYTYISPSSPVQWHPWDQLPFQRSQLVGELYRTHVRLQNLPWSKTGLVSRQVLHPLSKLQNWIWSKTGRYKTGLVSNTKIEASLRATKPKPWQSNLTSDTVEIFIQNEKAGLVPMQSRFRSRHKAGFGAAGLGTAQSWFWSRHKASFGAVSRPV